ncbi:MAG: hypothetical protein ACRELD_11320 [Longimicrobiales bacterium]
MARTFLDHDLQTWEVYASSGDFGYADPARLVFNCLTSRGQRPRYIRWDGGQTDAARQAATAAPEQLSALLEHAREVD